MFQGAITRSRSKSQPCVPFIQERKEQVFTEVLEEVVCAASMEGETELKKVDPAQLTPEKWYDMFQNLTIPCQT